MGGLICKLVRLPGPFGMLTTGTLAGAVIFSLSIIGLIAGSKDRANAIPGWLYGPIKGIGSIFILLFGKKSKFVSVPLEYKKQLHNDGGIGWVPYYGKPGRSCEEDKDCPTFQKCDGDKCVIPPRVR